ncbi:hypothetical protein GYMLUDRAFT_59192 [Collybiopsis luxurians FD-317 M1]|uniref:Transmembrane protein n=1 Tax=Collybiopsis luxurians FD-317 M1 TaxID=944289 RepID=A0A0D0BZF4_9AGAR|nr:hypothetical protein GYMLUDRAFT_59192 [Collybiopsis luxurians FD-317 M1]
MSTASNALDARCDCHNIQGVLTDATASITPLVAELSYITASNCTSEVLTPIITELKGCLSGAITEIEGFASLSLTAILTTADGVVLEVTDVAQLIVCILKLIFEACATIIKICPSANIKVVYALLCEVLVLVCTLLQTICGLISGLLICLIPLIPSVCFSVIATLDLKSTFSFIGATTPLTGSLSISP